MSWAWRTMSRTRSPTGVLPGSRTETTSRPWPLSHPASRCAWTDFPDASPPSNERKRPLTTLAPLGRLVRAPAARARAADRPHSSVDLDAPVGLVAGAARAQVRALDELVLHLPDIGVLRLELYLI